MDQEREDYAEPAHRRTLSPGERAVAAALATFAGIAVAIFGVLAFVIWWLQPFVGFN